MDCSCYHGGVTQCNTMVNNQFLLRCMCCRFNPHEVLATEKKLRKYSTTLLPRKIKT